jgi:thiol:disulfide interchange protein DsbD
MGRLSGLLLLLFALVAPAARAATSAAVTTPRTTAALVSASDHITPGQPLAVGLWLRLQPGWHTYWRNPGDSGSPPELHFILPPGAKAGPIAWPAPARQPEATLMTFGYSGSVLLPVQISDPASPIVLHASWLVCKHVCVPEQGDFTLTLTPGPATPSAEAPLFAAAAAATPKPPPAPWQATIAPDGTLQIRGEGVATASAREAFFLPDAADKVAAAAPQPMRLGDDRLTLALHPGPAFQPRQPLAGVLETVAADGRRQAFALTAEPGSVATAKPEARLAQLAELLGFALLGGLLLNVMPCVFPVLAVKAAGLAATARAPARSRVGHALAYALGVVLSFAAIGASLLALQEAGMSVGWGFQFQSPPFVAAVTWVLFAVGLNLSGVFALNWSGGGVGDGLASRADLLGSFFTGLLAVVVASPCTAPFMGAAIGTALAASPAVAMTVFLGLGLGLALPYVVLAVLPGFARLLPRPGAWMELLRQLLAFPMYGAGVWLLWVIGEESGPAGVLASASGLVLVGFAAWVLGYAQRHAGISSRGRRTAQATAMAALLIAVAVLPALAAHAPTGAMAAVPGTEPFSEARLAALRAEDRPVFVDFTAAWCITCLVNERLVLDRPEVREAFAAHHVVLLTGDWTREDPALTRFLRAHGRDGVPLYLFYPPKAPPVELPQILTEDAVLRLLRPLPR